MATLFIIVMILAVWHFVYESILLPTIRLGLRYKYFALRDKLSHLRESELKTPEHVIDYIENSINTSIRHIPVMTISLIVESKRFYKENPEIASEVDKKIEKLKNIEDPELQDVYNKSLRLSMDNVIYNTGGWLIYVLPFVIAYVFTSILGISMFQLSKQVQKLIVTPENQFSKLVNVDDCDVLAI